MILPACGSQLIRQRPMHSSVPRPHFYCCRHGVDRFDQQHPSSSNNRHFPLICMHLRAAFGGLPEKHGAKRRAASALQVPFLAPLGPNPRPARTRMRGIATGAARKLERELERRALGVARASFNGVLARAGPSQTLSPDVYLPRSETRGRKSGPKRNQRWCISTLPGLTRLSAEEIRT